MTFPVTKSHMTIGSKKKWVTKIDLDLESNAGSGSGSIKPNQSIHYIDIIDRSGSMYDAIDSLIDTLQALTSAMNPQDYRTIIWFSGSGEFRTLLKGVKSDASVNQVLESMRSTLGLTCFSESLNEALTIVQELTVADSTVINLFTDGVPTVSDLEAETNACFSLVSKLSNHPKVLGFNTIGFGYYDREFLVKLSDLSQHGNFSHIRELNDFDRIYLKNLESAQTLVLTNLEISVIKDKGNVKTLAVVDSTAVDGSSDFMDVEPDPLLSNRLDHVIYAGSAGSGIFAKSNVGAFKLKSLSPKNIFYVVTSKPVDLEVKINGETVDLKVVKSRSNQDQDFPYVAAAALYLRDRQLALDFLVNHAKDLGLSNLVLNSFTNDEVSDCLSHLVSAASNPKLRLLEGRISPGFIPNQAFCVMDLLGLIGSSYVPQLFNPDTPDPKFNQARLTKIQPYTRTRRKTTDNFNLFNPSCLAQSPGVLVYAENRLNVSVRFRLNGVVTLNPKAAESVGLDREVLSFIYRTHTFIKDGALNIKQAEFLLDPEMVETLKSKSKKIKVIASLDEPLLNKVRVILDFSRLPVINKQYLDKSLEIQNIYKVVAQITRLEAEQKVLNYLSDFFNKSKGGEEVGFESFNLNPEQIRVLTEHGITKSGSYAGIDNQRDPKDGLDYYEIRELSFYLKGVSSLPSLASVFKKLESKAKKSLTKSEDLVYQAITKYLGDKTNDFISLGSGSNGSTLDPESNSKSNWINETDLKSALTKTKEQLMASRNLLSIYKMALILTGNWLAVEGDAYQDMVIKTARVKEYIDPGLGQN